MPKNSYMFFANKDCEFYPCHKMPDGEDLNCMFCYCPFMFNTCPAGANPVSITPDGVEVKDCSNCTWVHKADNYPTIMKEICNRLFEI